MRYLIFYFLHYSNSFLPPNVGKSYHIHNRNQCLNEKIRLRKIAYYDIISSLSCKTFGIIMPSLNPTFKKAIKAILLEHYDIICYKITDITNYEGGATLLIYSLHCVMNNEKFTLYLQIPIPDETAGLSTVTFDVMAQPNSVDRVKIISMLCFTDELNAVFNTVTNIFNQLGIDLTFTTHKNLILLITGECSFKMDSFKILNYTPVLCTYLEIYAYPMEQHYQRKVCDFSIYGNSVDLSRSSISLNISQEVMTNDVNLKLTENFLKFYIIVLKERFHYLDDISLEDIEQASLDDLKNMVTVFKMALI